MSLKIDLSLVFLQVKRDIRNSQETIIQSDKNIKKKNSGVQ